LVVVYSTCVKIVY